MKIKDTLKDKRNLRTEEWTTRQEEIGKRNKKIR